MNHSLFHILDRLATDRWARRGVRTLLRAAWLGVAIWCAGLGAQLLWGWPLRANILSAAALAAIGVGVALLLRPRLKAHQAARRLDRRFHLDEQLATAIEVAATNPPPGSIAARLVAEADYTGALIERRLRQRQQPPWHDLLTLVLLSIVALGLTIMAGVGLPRLGADPLPLPPLAEPQDPAQQLPQEPRADEPGQPGSDGASPAQAQGVADPQITEALADALRDQGVTRAAAQAIDRGDTAGAARELRALADQAEQLSQATRDALAENLRAAADTIAPRNPGLADQLERSADGLERGEQAAAQALDDLARAIEQLPTAPSEQGDQGQTEQAGEQGQQPGQNGQPGDTGGAPPAAEPGQGQSDAGQQPGNGSGAGNGSGGEQRPADTSGRLGVEGQPVPLESAGAGEIPADASGPLAPGPGVPQPGFTQGDASSGRQVDVGADPLRVPMDERDVVQEYFQP